MFVCEHGAARRVIASAYFNRLAKEQDLNYKAIFRGTEPDSILTTTTMKGLINDRFEIEKWKPEKISEKDIAESYQIITFDCNLPNVSANEQWNNIPPIILKTLTKST